MFIFTYPLPGLSKEQREVLVDYAWVQTREFHLRKIELVDDDLVMHIRVPFEDRVETYNEILRRLNATINQRFVDSAPNPSLTLWDYTDRIRPSRHAQRYSALVAASAGQAPPPSVQVSVVRLPPLTESALEHLRTALTTGDDEDRFVIEQNPHRLKITMYAKDRFEMAELNQLLKSATEEEKSKRHRPGG